MDTDDVITLAENLAHNCGYAVFPCRRADKKPACPHGFKDATTDPVQVRPLWLRHPGPLIGVACGEASGISVLDVDIKGDHARAWWFQNQHRLPETRT
jgi:Bifunctional DNA primase/polymerase, N-terminal